MGNMCFACGKDNQIGFKLEFSGEGDKVWANFTPTELYQGYSDIMHGGLVTTLLDEAMAKVLNLRNIKAVTATLAVKFRKPVKIGQEVKIYGEMVQEKSRRCEIKGWVENTAGEVLAQANSIFIKV